MHIAFLTPEYPHPLSTSSGGLGTSIKNMVIALVERGIAATVFIYGQNQQKYFREEGINFHLIKQQQYKFLGWYLHRKYLQNYLNKFIQLEKIDAIEAPDWTGITAFMELKCPLVIRFHGSDSYFCELEGRPQKKKNFWFEKIALQGADRLLSVSEFTAEKTRKIFNLKGEIRVIPNSVDLEVFCPTGKRIDPNSILYFGSIIRKKGVLELAEIFNLIHKQNPKAHLIMAGRDVPDIQTRKSTRTLFETILNKECQGKVSWLGNLPYEQVKAQISKASVIVLPSFAEALPMTWIEAMAMEKGLVTSNIGWAREVMINGKTGFTVDPKDHQTYADKIILLMDDISLAKEMGKAARERVLDRFSKDIVVKENLIFYETLIVKKSF